MRIADVAMPMYRHLPRWTSASWMIVVANLFEKDEIVKALMAMTLIGTKTKS